MSGASTNTYAESRAISATKFEAFGINLAEVKRTVADMLSQIGKVGIFEEYTKHDISHIDEVLKLTDWLVDDDTKKVMTDADWFLITLSIYFHDMGMLVTREEFNNRERSAFPQFCDKLFTSGSHSAEYKAGVLALKPDDRERFLYQEFVRHNHATRVREWIEGTNKPSLGHTGSATTEVQRVLAGLEGTLKRDLGLIAESHHLEDLDDAAKYKPRQAYGPDVQEIANLQYCALILRSADLLHMRKDRTPSVLFKLINPVDPISQREWAKQNAVRAVLPRLGVNDDGVPDSKAPRDTVEVHARFTDENGFFGLTSFLAYANKELRQCYEWSELFKKKQGVKHSFNWRKIAEDKIETDGFLRKTFAFDLDQDKILDLLIGHTLYNDTSVVLRELTQNSIDAIRLQEVEARKAGSLQVDGHVRIEWSSTSRILTVTDNGTGMTQEIIEKHLLKVGSSRYQDSRFKEKYPQFSAISRFGIGVLSTFMISDEVEITTCSPDEPQGRKISLRSVHGRYLVRLLDKQREADALELGPHGTRVRMKVRKTARFDDVLARVQQWIVIPGCKVTVSVDGSDPVLVGHGSVGEAIGAYLSQAGYVDRAKYKVITKQTDGVELAYAVYWSEYFKDWSIMGIAPQRKTSFPIPCTCVEGIAVEFATPGMRDRGILALANATGLNAPKTNVARSSLEVTPERNSLCSKVYGLYFEHIKDEILRLKEEEGYSLTWAVNNAVGLVPYSFDDSSRGAVFQDALRERMNELPIYIVEKDRMRRNVSLKELLADKEFWTVDCELVRSTEKLLGEVATSSTVAEVIGSLGDNKHVMPSGTVLYNLNRSMSFRESVENECEPSEVRASEDLRRIDIKWAAGKDAWVRMPKVLMRLDGLPASRKYEQLSEFLTQHLGRGRGPRGSTVWLCKGGVTFSGLDQYAGITSSSRILMRDDVPLTKFLLKLAVDERENTLVDLVGYVGLLMMTW